MHFSANDQRHLSSSASVICATQLNVVAKESITSAMMLICTRARWKSIFFLLLSSSDLFSFLFYFQLYACRLLLSLTSPLQTHTHTHPWIDRRRSAPHRCSNAASPPSIYSGVVSDPLPCRPFPNRKNSTSTTSKRFKFVLTDRVTLDRSTGTPHRRSSIERVGRPQRRRSRSFAEPTRPTSSPRRSHPSVRKRWSNPTRTLSSRT